MLTRLTLTLTMLAPPTQKDADAAYNAGDFHKALDLFLDRAADPSVHRPDALDGAHASLIALHDETGEAEHLCRALTLARELLASGPFADDDERAAWVEIEARDIDTIKHAEVTCNAAPPTAMLTETPAPPTRLLATAALEPSEPDVDGLLPVTGPTPDSWRTTPQAPRGRGLAIAGGVTLGVGLSLTAAAGYIGGRMLDTWRDVHALRDEAGPIGTEAQAAKDAALTRDYERQRAPMVATAFVGVSAILVGAVLIGVGAKRLARATSRTALLPTPWGLVLRARF